MRSRIATHSQEVRSLRSYVGPARAVMAAAAEVVVTAQSNEKPDFDKSRKEFFESLFVNQSGAASNRRGRLWPSALWGTR